MSIGYSMTKADLDNKMGALVVALRSDFRSIVEFKAMLDDTTVLPDATLTSLGYTSGEITTIRSAFADLKKLSDIADAAATQAAANDFWFNAKHLTGGVPDAFQP